MRRTVYVETSIISYLATRPSRDLITAARAHIANAELRPGIERVCREQGYAAPVLCTPEELMGETEDD
jgi:hypothetical protein